MTASGSAGAAWTQCVAPSAPARSILGRLTSTAMIRRAPANAAPITHDSPTPPRPMTATVDPAGTAAVLHYRPDTRRHGTPDERGDLGRNAVGQGHDRRCRHDLRAGHGADREVGEDRRPIGPRQAGRAVGLAMTKRRRPGAQPLASALALATAQARRVPAERNRPPDHPGVEAGTDRRDDPRALVAHDDRAGPLPVAVAHVQVGVAHAGRRHPDQNLARSGIGEPEGLDAGRDPRALDDGGLDLVHRRRSRCSRQAWPCPRQRCPISRCSGARPRCR